MPRGGGGVDARVLGGSQISMLRPKRTTPALTPLFTRPRMICFLRSSYTGSCITSVLYSQDRPSAVPPDPNLEKLVTLVDRYAVFRILYNYKPLSVTREERSLSQFATLISTGLRQSEKRPRRGRVGTLAAPCKEPPGCPGGDRRVCAARVHQHSIRAAMCKVRLTNVKVFDPRFSACSLPDCAG